jgi:hypothetical protein
MNLPEAQHTAQRWRIHDLAPDFRLEDVWELRCAGGPDDFGALVAVIVAQDVSRSSSRSVRLLFALRTKLGDLFGWDSEDHRSATESLRARLPGDLRGLPVPGFAALPFTSLYLLRNEFAAEMLNRTVHGILHLGWVPGAAGGFQGQMAVLVKPVGLSGTAYMAAIRPFRHWIVYPAMIGQLERAGRRRQGGIRRAGQVAAG